MRTLRLTLVGTIILVLLSGLGLVVYAQSDEGNGPVTHFTGTRLSSVPDTTDEEWWEEDGIGHARVFRVAETVEWSDPRLPSEKQNVANFDMYNIGEFREVPMTGTTLLEGPDGYWSGEFTTYCDAEGACHGMSAVTGHGAYEGLFAIFRDSSPALDPDASSVAMVETVFEGLIFEGERPPMPDPIEPSAG